MTTLSISAPARGVLGSIRRRYLLGTAMAIVASMGAAATASAQQADTSSSKSTTLDTVTVTATGTNIAGVKPVGSDTVTLSRDQILQSGQIDISGVLDTVPQVQSNPSAGGMAFRQGGTAGYGSGSGEDSTQGTAINLRGLGTAATLVLVDGRRVVPSGASNAFTEAVQVPLAALQRVDVITDGNSAIYGSDAVAGVVNYVLRKDFDGLEISPRYTNTRYYDEWGGSITGGHTWSSLGSLGSGDLIITYDHDDRGAMIAGKSPYLRQDLVPLGGIDNRANNGSASPAGPTLITTTTGPTGANTYGYYAVPAGSGAGTTFSQLTTPPNLLDSSDYSDYLGRQIRNQLAGFFNQNLTPWLEVYYEGFYTNRQTLTRNFQPGTGNTVILCPASPYYIKGVPISSQTFQTSCGYTFGETLAFNPLTMVGQTYDTNPDETYSHTAGFIAKGPHDWKAEGYFTYAFDKTCGICNYSNNPNPSALSAQVTAGNINPLSGAPLTPAQLATFTGTNVQYSNNLLNDSVIKFDGPLFQLPGGMVKAAFGGEYSYDKQGLKNASNTAFPANPADNTFAVTNVASASRTVQSAFGELYVPVVGPDNAIPFVKALNLDAAVRYDDYSDFGGTTNPKVGGTWTVNDDLSFRGSWGTSFRAPYLTDTNPYNFSAALIGLPFANISGSPVAPANPVAYQIIGANPELKPETAHTWSLGFDFKPHWLSGFKFSTTYYNINYNNQIVSPNTGDYLNTLQNAQLYSKYMTPVHNPASCVNGNPSTYDPVLANFIAANPALYQISIFGPCAVNLIVDARAQNAASTLQDGLDFTANYVFSTEVGYWNVGGSVTKILDQKLAPVAGAPQVSVLDTYNYPVSLRARGQIGWSKGPWVVNLFVNYVGSYTNTVPLAGRPDSTVPAWATADIGVTYSVPKDFSVKWARNLRASVNVINFTDANPPVVLTQQGANYSAFDPSNANIFGRQITFQLTKDF
jgi:iron complex outermembrane receptor protein